MEAIYVIMRWIKADPGLLAVRYRWGLIVATVVIVVSASKILLVQ